MRKTFVLPLIVALLALSLGSGAVTYAGGGHESVAVCHQLGNGNWKALDVDDDAVNAHLGHGDFLIDAQHPCPPVNVTPEPTEEPTSEATSEPTEQVTPVVTDEPTSEPTEEVQPTEEVTPIVTDEPTEEATEPTVTSEPTEGTPEVTPPPVATTPAPTHNGNSARPQGVSVTVWSNLPGAVGERTVRWQIRSANGGWSDIVNPTTHQIIFTAIELRNRYNDTIGSVEYNVPMSRLTLGTNASRNPANYRALDAAGNIVGVWIQIGEQWCNNVSATCGTGQNHEGE